MHIDQFKEMPIEELRTLHREIGALITQRRAETLEKLREQAATLGFTVQDLMPRKRRAKGNGAQRRYRDPDDPENTWGGKGPKPQWLKDALEAGASIDDFLATA